MPQSRAANLKKQTPPIEPDKNPQKYRKLPRTTAASSYISPTDPD